MSYLDRRLRREHRRINALLETLLNATGAADSATRQNAWGELENCWLAHLEFEETRLFPVEDGGT